MKLSKIILCTALTALLASCGESSSKTALNNNANAGGTGDGGGNTIQPVPDKFIKLNEDEIQRDCSASEVKSVKTYEQLIQNSNSSVASTKGKKDDKVIAAGISAIQACDEVIRQVYSAGACRISRTTIDGLKFSYYDGYRVDEKCKATEKYLMAHDARPAKNQPPVVTPVDPHPGGGPVVVNPPVDQPPVPGGSLRQCSDGEFDKLKSSMGSVDLATTQISKQGQFASWKYDSDAIANAALGAKSCEALIAYHDQNPCERTATKSDGSKILRQYTGAYLRQRCETARTYFYEFVQNEKTLNFPNADLYLDVSGFEEKVFDTVPVPVQGCIVENHTDHAIDYSGRGKVLVKDSRGFSDKMMVLEMADGLLVQCYGLKVDGPFSKREVVNLFKKENTNMPLSYQLK